MGILPTTRHLSDQLLASYYLVCQRGDKISCTGYGFQHFDNIIEFLMFPYSWGERQYQSAEMEVQLLATPYFTGMTSHFCIVTFPLPPAKQPNDSFIFFSRYFRAKHNIFKCQHCIGCKNGETTSRYRKHSAWCESSFLLIWSCINIHWYWGRARARNRKIWLNSLLE